MKNLSIQLQDMLDNFDTVGDALYSVSHLLAIADNTNDQISYYHLANLLRLMGDGLQYRLQEAKLTLNN